MVTYRVGRKEGTREKLNFFEYPLFQRFDFGITQLLNIVIAQHYI